MDEPTEPLLGALSATYTIEREMGGGGMSRVFAAHEIALDRPVVIKVLPPELASAVSVERFRREIQLAARLQHPHIVPVLSAGEAGQSLYYTMPRVNGDSLRARLQRGGELPIIEAIRLLREIADALAAAHRQGVVHRDIKPENVLLSGDHAVVTDFGVAKAIAAGTSGDAQSGGLTSIGVALGTPTYMAPEQAAGDPTVDHRADLYALGVLAYEMLTGRPPFGGSPQAVLAAHMTSRAEQIGVARPSVPPGLAALVMRCLEKRAADRPQTADDVVRELRQIEADASGSREASGANPPRSAGRRALVVAGVAVVAALAGGLAWWRGRPPVRAAAASIAVMPFHPATADTALSRIGRDLVLTVGANLDGVGELKIADPLSVLAQAAASTEKATLDRDAEVARQFGARSFVRGTLVRVGSDVRADMKLYSADGVTEIAAATARGPAADFAALTDSVTWALLRNVWRNDARPTPTLASVRTKSVPALRAFLDGERFMIQNRWASAESSFARAIEADSSFWLAYWRYDYAHGWGNSIDTVVRRILSTHIDSLPERERLLARAMLTDSMPVAEAQSRALAERFPDSWMIRMRHADNLLPRWLLLGYSIDEARSGFEEPVRLNPGFAPGWEHLIRIGLKTRDTALLARAIPRYDSLVNAAGGPQDVVAAEARSMYAHLLQILRGDTTRAMSGLASEIRQPSSQFVSRPYEGVPLGLGFARVRNALTPLLAAHARDPVSTIQLRVSDGVAFASRGKWSELFDDLIYTRTIAPPQMSNELGFGLYAVAAVGAWAGSVDSTAPARFRPAAERAALNGPADLRARLAWFDGLAAFARGDRAAMSAARVAVRTAAAGRQSLILDRSLAAFELAMQGAIDRAALALDSAERERMVLRSTMEEVGTAFLTPVNRLAASRWLMARGDTVEAARLLTWVQIDAVDDSQVPIMLLAPLALHEQARIEEAQGHRDRALRLYSQFLDVYDLAPPAHRTLVADAREAVARLSGLKEPKR